MRILAISNCYPPFHAGGYGVLCHRLCECLGELGHDVTVLTTSAPKDNYPDPGGHPISVTVLRELSFLEHMHPGLLLWNTLRNKKIVSRCIRAIKPDLVYCFGVDRIGYQVYHTAVESGVPSVTVVGDTWLGQAWRDLPKYDPWIEFAMGRNSQGWKYVVKRIIGRLGNILGLYSGMRPLSVPIVHVISTVLADDLRSAGMPWLPLSHLIKYPLAPPFVSVDGAPVGQDGSISSTLRVLFLSRMEPLKGPDIAIKGVAGAVAQGANVTLTLAGIGVEKMTQELSRLASDLHVSDRIAWREAPTPDALVALYRSHDIFVFPSLIAEGLGIVCLEAMACGLPVLATRGWGQMDLVKEGETGFTFPKGDDKGLANLIYDLAHDRQKLSRLSIGSLAMAKQHNLSATKKSLDAWINDAILQ
jgi:glycosyltransferase involved in cell wall biosynthesis